MNKLFLLFALIIANCGFAQNYAYIEKDSIANLHYRLSDNQELYNTDIYFPYDGGNKGVDILQLKSDIEFTYQLPLKNPIHFTSQTRLSMPVFFTNNIKSFEILLNDNEGSKYLFSKKIDLDGYQPSIFTTIPKENGVNNLDRQNLRIVIRVTSFFDKTLPFRLVLSNLTFADYANQQIISPLPFFKTLFDLNRTNITNKLTPSYKNSKSNTDWFSMEYGRSPAFIHEDKFISNKNLLYNIIKEAVISYPFYEEKKQKQSDVLRKLDYIWKRDSLKSECEIAEAFQRLLRKSLHDGHFKIDLKCNVDIIDKRVLGPLRIYPINNRYQISAVLDTLLEKEIPLGSVIVKIDEREIDKILDSLKEQNYSNSFFEDRKLLVMQEMSKDIVAFNEGSKVIYEYITPKGEHKQTAVTYRKKYPLKSNFTNPHCEYKCIDINTSYFKFNVFDELPVLRLQSIIDTIKHKNLIIDVRGNGGGDMSFVDDLLSFFTKTPQIFLTKVKQVNSNLEDSLFVENKNPNKVATLSKVVLLVDSKTACATEVFINALKKCNKNTTIIGVDNTSGTLANVFYVNLPTKDYTLVLNSPGIYKYYFGYQFEDVGIAPDIKVNIDNVYDLKPYNDKVLQTAIRFLKPKIALGNVKESN
jgi:C-terminal processing protease CtpA/Prc